MIFELNIISLFYAGYLQDNRFGVFKGTSRESCNDDPCWYSVICGELVSNVMSI